ncbi:MAG: hypothetical protein IID34_07530 [Planctomycetes bacterium]|nr:hypothetical protein [Planctomycetota bacterium]
MQRSQQTKARFTRLCQIGAVLLAVPILMAIGCPLTVTLNCPTAGEAGTATTVTVSVSFGQGAATWTTDATNGTVADGTTASPSVTPTAAGTVTVTATATDEAGETATETCEFEATAEPCTDDTDCDDGLFCNGAETCDTDAGSCVAGTDQCTGDGESCDEANDACITTCDTDADCDDGDACTTDTCVSGTCSYATVDCDDSDACTDDSCDVATGCVNTDVVCDAGQECSGGVCVTTCTAAVDCDDSDPCTDEACVSGLCENTAKDCDDGDLCTTDSCDADTGDCVNDAVVCDAGFACDDATGVCEELDDCTADVDCDDNVFCNGAETCDLTDPLAGICAAGTDPCATDETCNETTNACDAPPGCSVSLTLGTDTVVCGSGDDSIDGSLEISGGNPFQTLNNSDNISTGTGTDTLSVQFRLGGTTTPANLSGVNIFNLEITDNNDTTLNMLNADSITTINNNNSGANLTVMNIQTFASTVGMTNTTQNTTITVLAAALSSATDSVDLNITGVTVAGIEPVVTLQPSAAGSGFETINLNSLGGVANNLFDLVDGAGNSFATLNISGTQDITIDTALNATVTTVNGSGASGKIDVLLGANNATVTGGSGDDTLRFGGNFNTNDTVDGGPATTADVLESTSANFTGTTDPQGNVSNVETIRTTDALGGNLNVVHWGAQNATVAGKDGVARNITIPDGGVVEFTADGGANATVVLLSGDDTTTNTFSLKLNGAVSADMAGDLTATSFETMNLECTGTADAGSNEMQAITLNNTAATESIIITGGISLDINGVITADIVDAGAFTGGFDNVDGGAAGAIAITTGNGIDSVRGSAGADILIAGDSNDRIQGDAGSDLLTGGNGNDTFDQDNIAQADTDTITDFNAGTSTSSNDIFIWDISSIEAFAAVTDLVDTSANSGAAGNNTFVQLGSDGQTVANADIVGLIGDYTNAADALANQTSWTIVYGATLTDNDAYLVAYTSGSNVRIAVAVDNGGGANSDSVDGLFDIAILQNVSLSNLDSGDFNSEL